MPARACCAASAGLVPPPRARTKPSWWWPVPSVPPARKSISAVMATLPLGGGVAVGEGLVAGEDGAAVGFADIADAGGEHGGADGGCDGEAFALGEEHGFALVLADPGVVVGALVADLDVDVEEEAEGGAVERKEADVHEEGVADGVGDDLFFDSVAAVFCGGDDAGAGSAGGEPGNGVVGVEGLVREEVGVGGV